MTTRAVTDALIDLVSQCQSDKVPTIDEILAAFADGEGRIARSKFKILEELATNIRYAMLDADIKNG